MFYKRFQRQCLLDLFKPTQCVTEIGHQPLLRPKEFSGVESRYVLDGRKVKQLRVSIHMQILYSIIYNSPINMQEKDSNSRHAFMARI